MKIDMARVSLAIGFAGVLISWNLSSASYMTQSDNLIQMQQLAAAPTEDPPPDPPPGPGKVLQQFTERRVAPSAPPPDPPVGSQRFGVDKPAALPKDPSTMAPAPDPPPDPPGNNPKNQTPKVKKKTKPKDE